jgi:hypothetical protein
MLSIVVKIPRTNPIDKEFGIKKRISENFFLVSKGLKFRLK